MKNLFQKEAQSEIDNRIDKITADSAALWGKMNVGEMICHVSDQLRMALGDIETTDASNWLQRNLLITFIMWGLKAPKGKVQTSVELEQHGGKGTKPETLAADKDKLKILIQRFIERNETGGTYSRHSVFGQLNNKRWSKLAYSHLDHHLEQFGA